MATLTKSNVICADSIERINKDGMPIQFEMDDSFDIVLANPPFGAKIIIGSEQTKKSFDLAHCWRKDKDTERFVKTDKISPNPTPQILFLELCLKLLKPGGRMGISCPRKHDIKLFWGICCSIFIGEFKP